VGLVALPLAMAFAIASGMKPESGIYTAVVAGFVISALGGSKVQIGGPTAKFGVSGLMIVTAMAGVILVLMGLTGLGTAVRFIPRPVTIGFTNGIAVLIASTQIKGFLGLHTGAVPGEFVARMRVLASALPTVQWQAAALSVASLALILLVPRFTRRVPGSIIALPFATVCVAFFKFPVATIGSAFGGIPTGLPAIRIPDFRPEIIFHCSPPPSRLRCSARWKAFSPRLYPTA
jgi:SulP family sulfate permease